MLLRKDQEQVLFWFRPGYLCLLCVSTVPVVCLFYVCRARLAVRLFRAYYMRPLSSISGLWPLLGVVWLSIAAAGRL